MTTPSNTVMAFCAYCGSELEANASFCQVCGKPVQPPATQPGASAPGAPELASPGKIGVTQAVRMREESDRVMSVAWIFLPLLGVVFGIVDVASIFILGLGALFLAFGLVMVDLLLFLAFWYLLISRRNNHFRRDKLLRDGLVEYLRQEAAAMGKTNDINVELATMNSINGEASAEEKEKSAVLWIILDIVTFGLLGLYILYFLTKDPYKHDSRQQAFMQQVQSALSKLGKTAVNPSWKVLPSRSYFLYLVLSIITFGLFEFYWNYALIVDLNNHFKAQWQLEDSILAAI